MIMQTPRGSEGDAEPMIERRVDRVEGHIDAHSERLVRVEVEIARLSERIAHLPSKDFIVKTVLGTGAVLGAITIFGEKLQQLFGVG